MNAFYWSFLIAIITCCIATINTASITITGSTGILGRSICHNLLRNGHRLYCGYRNLEKAHELLEECTLKRLAKPKMFYCNYDDFGGSGLFDIPGFGSCDQDDQILILNSGISIVGCDSHSLAEQVRINSIIPMKISLSIVEYKKLRHTSKGNLTILFVSSGDGESVFINSDIWKDISSLNNLDDWFRYSSTITDRLGVEFAFGDTPGYSLSKALLNRGAMLLSARCNQLQLPIRVLAVCPGNFISGMSSPEEISTSIPVEQAGADVIEVALNASYPGGRFYRHRREITWWN